MEVPGVVGLSRIGAGGFAEVYRGVLGTTGDPVAVKVFAHGTEARVEREAAALTEVGPPVVPRLHGHALTPEGRPVLIMELVSGTPLAAAAITRGTQEEKLDALWRAAIAIDRLHERGWMHRDLKPDHLVLRGNERITLLDLGSALRAGEGAVNVVDEPGVDPMALTADGAALGTPRYMAPEQCTGNREIGPPADIYSLGVIAYELIAGRPPFVGEPAVIRSAHMATQPPRLSSLVDVPRAADAVMMRCLAKDPAQRHARATELVAALTAALAHGSDERPLTLPADSSPRRMALLAVRSRGAVVDIDHALGPRAILARAQGDRLVVALPAPGPTSTAVLAALRLADRMRAALSIDDPVVHVAELRLKRRGTRLACAGPALDDLAWADHPSVRAARASLTEAAAGELDATTLATVTGASASPAAAREPTLVGLDRTLAAVAADAARGPGLATVLGGAGAGKSRFLAELGRELERRGVGPIARVSARDLVVARNMPLAATLAGSRLPPKAILVDDAHVADSAALDAIELASLDHPSAWVCVAALPELVEKRPAWDARALRAGRWTLAPLEPADAAALLREVLAAEFMPDAVVDRLVEAGAGVPLHLVELALGLHQSGALRSRPGTDGVYVAADHLVHLSSTPLGDRMAERALSEMPPSSILFARLCAVLGDDVDVADIEDAQRAAGGDEWVDARVGLARLSAADVLTQVSPTRWRFEHRMLRQGILSGTPAGEREMLHRAALAVEQGRPEPRFDRLAQHASAVGDREAAWTAYSALAIGSAEAGHHMEAELAWTSALGNLPPSDPRREDALVGRARAREKLQAFDESLSDLGSALELAVARGDSRAGANIRLDEATVQDWRLRWDESRQAAEAARDLASGLDDMRLSARLDLAFGRSAARSEQMEQAADLLSRAGDAPGADHETRAIALLLLAGVLVFADRNAEAEVRFRQVVELCESRGDAFHHAAALVNRPMLWARLNRLDEAEADIRNAIALARRMGAAQLERLANHNLAETLYWRRDLGEALARAERALVLRTRFSGDAHAEDALLVALIQLSLGDEEAATAARRRASNLDTPKDHATARIVDLALAGAPAAEWNEAERDSPAPYAELSIEFAIWATRTLAKVGDVSNARTWLREARARVGTRAAWQPQLSDLALDVGED